MARNLQIAHFGLRTRNLPVAVDWYGKVFGARVMYENELMAFMSFDDEHHRFVIWDDGETQARDAAAHGVDHIGFGCGGPLELADEYERLKALGVLPAMSVNHSFTSSLYYRDPDGNEVELTCDNFPTKAECEAFMKSPAMAAAMSPPTFGAEFDPEDLLLRRRAGAPAAELARIGVGP